MSGYVVSSPSGSVVGARGAESAHRASRRANMAGGSVNRAWQKPEVATRFVGNCQVCEGDFKLYYNRPGEGVPSAESDDMRMVHHGYKRPGHGNIVGDCPGVGELPYERSKVLVDSMLANTEVSLAQSQGYLSLLNAGKVDRITRQEWSYDTSGGTKPKLYVRSEVEDWQWRKVLNEETRDTEREVDFWDRRVKHLQMRVDNWRLRPVRTFDEILEKEQVKKAERSQIVAEKRATRDAKIAATKAKQADLAARREAIAKDLAVQFRALADAGDVKGGQTLARKQKKHMGWLDVDKLGVNAALVKLGLARLREPEHRRFADDIWVEHHYFR